MEAFISSEKFAESLAIFFVFMDNEITLVTIAVITCNRPAGLGKLLAALSCLEFPHFPEIALRFVVVENGRKLEAEGQVDQYREAGLDIVYAHEPTPGISYARNCAISLAMEQSHWVATIDDDEYPEALWLDELLRCAQQYNTSVVRAPVVSVYESEIPAWAKVEGFYERERFATGTIMKYCASGNVLMRSELLREAGIRFDSRFALTGGEDTLFFMQLQKKTGEAIVWCDSAIAYEDVPAERVSVPWLLRRSKREGSCMPQFDTVLGGRRLFRVRWVFHGIAHLLIGLLTWLLGCFSGEPKRIRGRVSFALGMGMIQGSFGKQINEYSERH